MADDSATVDWRHERFISHAMCKWPFRVRVDALHLSAQFLKHQVSSDICYKSFAPTVCTYVLYVHVTVTGCMWYQIYKYSDFKLEYVWVEVALYMNGKIIRDPKGREVIG